MIQMAKKKEPVQRSGKRKTAIARATVSLGKGRVRINHKPIEIWEPQMAKDKMMTPMRLAGDRVKKVDIKVKVKGGGIMGQADAVTTAIAKVLVDYFDDEELRARYMAYDRTLLVSDPRRKEPKHPLGRGARRKRQKSFR